MGMCSDGLAGEAMVLQLGQLDCPGGDIGVCWEYVLLRVRAVGGHILADRQHDNREDKDRRIDMVQYEDQNGIKAGFVTKDSGKREEFETGMVRDTQDDKPRYDLIWKPGLKRLAELMARGSVKYGARNWEKASTVEELERFRSSANRHFEQWMLGDTDEDHMCGCIFNMFGAEFVREKLNAK
jgi:Domain of unknown function (DUF5664)